MTTGAERTAALDAVLPSLACPVCLAPVTRAGAALVCRAGHTYDLARQGYAALAVGAAARGDTAPMVGARRAFQAAGHLDAVAAAVVDAVPQGVGLVADLAGGPGFYAARVLDARPGARGILLDAAAPAARAAAGLHPRLAAATADVWRRLPLARGAVDVALSIFGPRDGPELARVLAPDGIVVVVTPLPAHLAELRGPFGTLAVGEGKAERTAARLAPLSQTTAVEVVERRTLTPDDAAHAVLMGPSGHHLDAAAVRASAAALDEIAVTVAVTVATFVL